MTRVGYWRKIVVGVKGSRDRRDIGRVVAGCWRKDVIEVFSSTGRKEGFAHLSPGLDIMSLSVTGR